jgi:hypothetical protein
MKEKESAGPKKRQYICMKNTWAYRYPFASSQLPNTIRQVC